MNPLQIISVCSVDIGAKKLFVVTCRIVVFVLCATNTTSLLLLFFTSLLESALCAVNTLFVVFVLYVFTVSALCAINARRKRALCSSIWQKSCLSWLADLLVNTQSHPEKYEYLPGCGTIKTTSHPGKYEYCSADLAKYSCYSSVKPFVSMPSWATIQYI